LPHLQHNCEKSLPLLVVRYISLHSPLYILPPVTLLFILVNDHAVIQKLLPVCKAKGFSMNEGLEFKVLPMYRALELTCKFIIMILPFLEKLHGSFV
jgi:hypothetical protein